MQQTESWLCVGLDPDPDQLPADLPLTPAGFLAFCRSIIDATISSAAAYKVNFAFFEALGPEGWRILSQVREAIPDNVPVIADAKRGDIPNTARFYARAIFDALGFDGVTVNPYAGLDSLEPFTAYEGKAVFVLCKTSNPGAPYLQDVEVEGEPLYMRIARDVLALQCPAEVGLVVGATQSEALASVRRISEEALILAPGVGAQGASAGEVAKIAANEDGDNVLPNASRQILHASQSEGYPHASRLVAEKMAAETWRTAERERGSDRVSSRR